MDDLPSNASFNESLAYSQMDSQAINKKVVQPGRPRVWIDADACPNLVKDLLFRTSRKRDVQLVLVANQTPNAPESTRVKVVTVPHGADKADNWIVDQIVAGEIVITGDIPLAARAVEKDCIAIDFRGALYDEKSIGERLASRNLMDQMRSAGMELNGPKPFNQKDLQRFANQLDRSLTKFLRSQKPRQKSPD